MNPGTSNVCTNCPRLTQTERLHLPKGIAVKCYGQLSIILPEQMANTCLLDGIAKFCPPEGLVVDPCAGTFSTANSCMLFSKQRIFIGTDIYPLCPNTALPGLVETFARKCLNTESDITSNVAIVAAAKTLIKDINAINFRRKLDAWDIPPGLNGVQTFPIDIHHVLSLVNENIEIVNLANYSFMN